MRNLVQTIQILKLFWLTFKIWYKICRQVDWSICNSFYRYYEKQNHLIRDRVGQKPLFYSTDNNELSFSSYWISLSKLNKLKTIDDKQVMNYLNLGVIPSPNTIFKNIFKVEPGCIIEINHSHNNLDLKVNRY